MFTVINTYEIEGTSNHRTPEAALKACDKREGEGWIVIDNDGQQWTWYNSTGYKRDRKAVMM